MLRVFKGRAGDWLYFNSQDDRDKGSVVDWMKNRMSTGWIAGITQLPDRNRWRSVNDHLRAYLNLPAAERPSWRCPHRRKDRQFVDRKSTDSHQLVSPVNLKIKGARYEN